jgi:hypothetical protein
METDIPSSEMSKIIDGFCRKSKIFDNFYKKEISKLKDYTIRWKYNPKQDEDGICRCSRVCNTKTCNIMLKKHPSELLKNNSPFLIVHEIGHLLQREEGYPSIQLTTHFLEIFRDKDYNKISPSLNSMVYDFPVNAKLKEYGFEIPQQCYNPPINDNSLYFTVKYILRYVLIRRYSLLVSEKCNKEIQECLGKYNNTHLVTVGNKIFEILNNSSFISADENVDKISIKFTVEKIFSNLQEFFTFPYKFVLTFVVNGDCIQIGVKRI